MFKTLTVVVAFGAVSAAAHALGPAATRGLRNAEIAVRSVQLIPELRCGNIAKEKLQSARNLLRDLDSALARGQGEIGRMSQSDRSDAAVAQAIHTLEEYARFRNDLKTNLDSGHCE